MRRLDSAYLADLEPFADGAFQIVPTTIVEPRHQDACELLAYWKMCRARGGLQLGRDMPAREIARLMSKLNVLEPINENIDFRIRLAGSGLMRRFGVDVSHKLLSDLYQGKTLDHYLAGLKNALTTGRPNFVDVQLIAKHRDIVHMEYVELPVTAYDAASKWMLTGAFYFD